MTNPPFPINMRLIARQFMRDFGFIVDFPPEATSQLSHLTEPSFDRTAGRDLTSWLWSSIDNDDSKDLDQIEYAQTEKDGTRIYVGIANVDWFVPRGSAIDGAAQHNTTSIYTGAQTFPMLPEKLCTDLSSLLENQKRLAVVVDMKVNGEGTFTESSVYPAAVKNKAQLTYEGVAAWLGSKEGKPASGTSEITAQIIGKIQGNSELQKQLLLQDKVAQALRQKRHEAGALTFGAIEFRPTMTAEGSIDLKSQVVNQATQLIEDFMIAANRASVAFLENKGFPSLQRVVRTPKRWDRIVALAATHGATLPTQPNSKSLQDFLLQQQRKNPDHFPDLSLSVIKLLGRGEYVVKSLQEKSPGHFGLAVENYSHSTAPNRRYPDILTQRLLLAALEGKKAPYETAELQALAQHCTEKEDDANRVERAVRKSIAAIVLSRRIGEEFPGIITGASEKGVWVRIISPPVEGKIMGDVKRVDVGDRVRVRLVDTNPQRGYIDFKLTAVLPS